jgi:hypothetical protein
MSKLSQTWSTTGELALDVMMEGKEESKRVKIKGK